MHQSLDSSLVPTLWVEDSSSLEMFHPNSPFDDEEFKFEKPFSRQSSLEQDAFVGISQNPMDAPSYAEALNLEYELWEEQFLPGGKVDPTLAELNDDQRSRSPLINPEMQSLYNAATRTVGETSNETSRPTALRPPEQPNALVSEEREIKTQGHLLPVKTEIKKETEECMDNVCSETVSFVKKEEDKSCKSQGNWSSTVVRPNSSRRETKLVVEQAPPQIVDNSQTKWKLSQQGKLESKPLQLPQLISAEQHSQIYSLNGQGGTLAARSKAEDQVAELENTTSPLNVDNSDSDGEMDIIDSDEDDYDVEDLSPIDPSSSKPRKGRRGEDNLIPNPRRLLQIGRELDKLNKTISDLKPIHQLPMSAKNKSRKEKNKLASRACRLKKKAQHEANKVKLCGLEAEEQRLTKLLHCVKAELLTRERNRNRKYSSLTIRLEELASSMLKGQSIAGHTPEFIDAVIKATARGTPNGGLNNIFDITKM